MKKCTSCVLPETHETIAFDNKGVCNICTQVSVQKENVDWAQKRKDLDVLINQYKGKYDYDCIIPYSGGKDSTWNVYYLVKVLKLKALVVRFNHWFMRPNLNDNTTRVFRELGADFHDFTPNWKITQKLMLQSFLDKGDFCWHCHSGIFSYPMQVAVKFNIPLIFWGEPSAEYTAYYSYDQPEEVDEKRFNRFINLGISADDMYVRLGGKVDKRDLSPYQYPKLKDLRRINYRSVCLGSYIPWDVKKQSKIISKELGWKGDRVENVPEEYSYEKIECYMQGVRDWIKFIKRGYARPSHLTSIDIRNNRLTRKEAVSIVKKYEGKEPPSLEIFLELVGISKEEFYQISLSHTVSPWKFDMNNIEKGEKLKDFDKWSRDGKMDRKDAEEQIKTWSLRKKN